MLVVIVIHYNAIFIKLDQKSYIYFLYINTFTVGADYTMKESKKLEILQKHTDEEDYPLHQAIKSGDRDEIRKILSEEKSSLESLLIPDHEGKIPLEYATDRSIHCWLINVMIKRLRTGNNDPNFTMPE